MSEPTIIDAISDEVFKDKIKSFNRIMSLSVVTCFIYLTAVFILLQLSNNDLYSLLILLPLFLLVPLYKRYLPSVFYLKLSTREDYQQYARSYPFARMLYDKKFERIVLLGFMLVLMGWFYIVKYAVNLVYSTM
jgi:hypothetical protein